MSFRIVEQGVGNIMPGLRTVTTELANGVATVRSKSEHLISRPTSGMFSPMERGLPAKADISATRASPIRKALEETPLHDAVAGLESIGAALGLEGVKVYRLDTGRALFRVQPVGDRWLNPGDVGAKLSDAQITDLETAARKLLDHLDSAYGG